MSSWDGKSKGTVLGYGIVIFCLRTFGLTNTYSLVKVISYYYYQFAGKPKNALIHFYSRRLGVSESQAKRLTRKNFYNLAQNILDRTALSLALQSKLSVESEMRPILQEWLNDGQGAIVLSAHAGNWAAAGHLLQSKNSKVNVVMFANEVKELKEFLERNGIVPNFNTIPIKDDLSHVVEIYKAIKGGELVCLLADRFLPKMPTTVHSFLGQEAHFPLGPFQLVEKLKARCMFIYAMKDTKFEYTLHAKICDSSTQKEIASEYVKNLEEIVRKYPDQWYNYHDFYTTPEAN